MTHYPLMLTGERIGGVGIDHRGETDDKKVVAGDWGKNEFVAASGTHVRCHRQNSRLARMIADEKDGRKMNVSEDQ